MEHSGHTANCRIELSRSALTHNVRALRRLLHAECELMAVVKANAYGHGMLEVASIALEAGASWLGVFSASEALTLRGAGISAPVLVLGPPDRLEEAVAAKVQITVASMAAARAVAELGGRGPVVHLKIETGTQRQGLCGAELIEAAVSLKRAGAVLEGAYTHFADIEDTTDHSFASEQLACYGDQLAALERAGIRIKVPHAACSAAAILFPPTHLGIARVGIALYGLWPSRETLVSAKALGRNALELRPVMSWKTAVAQIKELAAGEFVGYGRTYKTTRKTRLAVLPVGYADGYDRGMSNAGHVLVRGMRAPVRGRVCMNLTMIDVTDVQGAAVGDEVVLLGRQGDELVSAEDLARQLGTISYEVVTRAAPNAPRVVVE